MLTNSVLIVHTIAQVSKSLENWFFRFSSWSWQFLPSDFVNLHILMTIFSHESFYMNQEVSTLLFTIQNMSSLETLTKKLHVHRAAAKPNARRKHTAGSVIQSKAAQATKAKTRAECKFRFKSFLKCMIYLWSKELEEGQCERRMGRSSNAGVLMYFPSGAFQL